MREHPAQVTKAVAGNAPTQSRADIASKPSGHLMTRDRSRERLSVGLSRATDKLVVVGDPEVASEWEETGFLSSCVEVRFSRVRLWHDRRVVQTGLSQKLEVRP